VWGHVPALGTCFEVVGHVRTAHCAHTPSCVWCFRCQGISPFHHPARSPVYPGSCHTRSSKSITVINTALQAPFSRLFTAPSWTPSGSRSPPPSLTKKKHTTQTPANLFVPASPYVGPFISRLSIPASTLRSRLRHCAALRVPQLIRLSTGACVVVKP
jgi:hypothetical protein